MTPQERKLFELALAALEISDEFVPVQEAIAAIKEALAQPEPVMHTLNCVCNAVWDIKTDGSEEMVHTPYTTPPPRKPLTDEQIDEIYFKSSLVVVNRCDDMYDFVRAIEAAHNIKE